MSWDGAQYNAWAHHPNRADYAYWIQTCPRWWKSTLEWPATGLEMTQTYECDCGSIRHIMPFKFLSSISRVWTAINLNLHIWRFKLMVQVSVIPADHDPSGEEPRKFWTGAWLLTYNRVLAPELHKLRILNVRKGFQVIVAHASETFLLHKIWWHRSKVMDMEQYKYLNLPDWIPESMVLE